MRVRGFTQDDAHIYCTPDQVESEILGVLDLCLDFLRTFGYERYDVDLSVWDPAKPQNYAGDAAGWEMGERALRKALEARSLSFTRREGEAAFYGPKIDIKMYDAIGRAWQGPTVQFDFNLPKRLDITYVGSDSAAAPVIMVHRAIYGSLERFVGGLVEHYAGAFPLWLAPVQAMVLPIADRHREYAQKVREDLASAGLRVETDERNEKIGAKIRDAQLKKIPFMLIAGDREAQAGTVAVRNRKEGEVGARPLAEVRDLMVRMQTERVLGP
jgi:threonyl-tRNA synthetase